MGFVRRLLGTVRPDAVRHPAWVLDPERADARVVVVGTDRYRDAVRRVAGGLTATGPLVADHLAALIPEPEHASDDDAVCVRIAGRRVGYLESTDAHAYGPALRLAASHRRLLAVEAHLSGGEETAAGSSSLLVTLHLGTPGETLLAVRDAAGTPVELRTDHPWPGAMVCFDGESALRFEGSRLDRATAASLASRAGMVVHPRVTRRVRVLVDCDTRGDSPDHRKALDYGIAIVPEMTFWSSLGIAVRRGEEDLQTAARHAPAPTGHPHPLTEPIPR